MPINKDATGKHWVEMNIVVAGTPAQVWHAMATGAGNSAWFTKTEIEERVGGALRFEFGPDGGSLGEVTAWEPLRRFGYVERNWAEGAPPVETEITITGRGSDGCQVRMVHWISTTADDWDSHLESFEGGWPGFFEVLKMYLAHFAGQPAASVRVGTSFTGDERFAWKKLTDALRLGGLCVGDRCEAAASTPGLAGVVERIHQDRTKRDIMVRLDQPGPGIALVGSYSYGGQTRGMISFYFYGDRASSMAETAGQQWGAWLSQFFAT